MKKIVIIVAVISLTACTQGSEDQKDIQPQSAASSSKQVKKQASLNFNNENIRLSYAMGLDIAKSLKGMGMDIDKAAFMQAFEDFQNEKKHQLSTVQASEAKQAFFKQQKQAKKK